MIDTAIILAAGSGSRLRKTTDIDLPKPLHKICGKELIWHSINSLTIAGIRNFIIVLGYEHQEIRPTLQAIENDSSQYPIKISTIVNPMWQTSKTGVSLMYGILRMREAFVMTPDDHFLCCMGDHIYQPELIKKMLRIYEIQPKTAQVAVDYALQLYPGRKQTTYIQAREYSININGIIKIGRHIYPANDITSGVDAGISLLPVKIFDIINYLYFYNNKKTPNVDLCEAIQKYVNDNPVIAVNTYPWFWININTLNDLEIAENSLKKEGKVIV